MEVHTCMTWAFSLTDGDLVVDRPSQRLPVDNSLSRILANCIFMLLWYDCSISHLPESNRKESFQAVHSVTIPPPWLWLSNGPQWVKDVKGYEEQKQPPSRLDGEWRHWKWHFIAISFCDRTLHLYGSCGLLGLIRFNNVCLASRVSVSFSSSVLSLVLLWRALPLFVTVYDFLEGSCSRDVRWGSYSRSSPVAGAQGVCMLQYWLQWDKWAMIPRTVLPRGSRYEMQLNSNSTNQKHGLNFWWRAILAKPEKVSAPSPCS